jgi:hypothetical protein
MVDEKRGTIKKIQREEVSVPTPRTYIAVAVYDVVLRFLITIDAMVVHLLRLVALLHVNHESIP